MIWLIVLAGYLAGSIPTGVLLGRVAGRDPRAGGSGNIGASNVTRTLGRKWGAITLVVDVLKGLVPTLVALKVAGLEVGLSTGFAAVVGHCFPVWLRFRGGKGVATAFGAVAAVMPIVAVVAALVWGALVFFTRTPAIASLVAAVLFVVLPRTQGQPFEVHVFTLALFVLIALRHASNLRVLKRRYAARGKAPTGRSGRKGGKRRR